MALLRAAMPTFNKNADGGVFLITSSIAVSSGILSHQQGLIDIGQLNRRQFNALLRYKSRATPSHEVHGQNAGRQSTNQCCLAGSAAH